MHSAFKFGLKLDIGLQRKTKTEFKWKDKVMQTLCLVGRGLHFTNLLINLQLITMNMILVKFAIWGCATTLNIIWLCSIQNWASHAQMIYQTLHEYGRQ